MRKLGLYLYEEICTWLRGIRSLQDFAHDGHVILTHASTCEAAEII
jgi:hypothetical protein